VLGIRYLEGLICLFIGAMSACFVLNWAHSPPTGTALLTGWAVPAMQTWAVTQAVGTIGAVIMPHNLYLHSGLVLTRRVRKTSRRAVHDAIWYSRIESAGARFLKHFFTCVLCDAALLFPRRTMRSSSPGLERLERTLCPS
jgi:natural resistance-associated macrophage protein